MEAISNTALVTVQAYLNIAVDPAKRGTLISDETSIQFLAYVLGEKNVEVVGLALETLQLLADTPRHRQKLAAVFGVLEALQATADNPDEFGEDLANSAADIFTSLKFTRNAAFKSNRKLIPCLEKVSQPSTEDAPEDEGLFGALDTSSHSDKGHRFLKFNSKAKTITIQVNGLTTQDDRELLERQLIKVQGVISIVFDANNSRVTLRSRPDLSVESVGQAVRKTQTMKAFLIGKNDMGEEVMKSIGEANAEEVSESNSPLPDYLPEDDITSEPSDKAVAPHGITETATNWISSAATFLQRSFYW